MKIGILGCGYSCENELLERLETWFHIAKTKNFIFSFTSCPFLEYKELNIFQDNTKTLNILTELKNKNNIQYLYTSNDFVDESTARNYALKPLLQENVDYVWLLDLSDEYYSIQDLNNILNFVSDNPYHDWFSINFKNYIFNNKQWIDGFCPPRIFKNKEKKIEKFYWDNDVIYTQNNKQINYKELSECKVPSNIAHIKHLTWLHSNGKIKFEYQMKHFGHCSYKWNYEKNELEFNHDFYKKYNLELPIINKDL
jgi:hypothetical protein